MRVITFGFDCRALIEEDGHSKRWNTRMADQVELLDILVEDPSGKLTVRYLAPNVRVIPVHVPHQLLYPALTCRRALQEHRRQHYQLATADDPFRAAMATWMFKKAAHIKMSIEYHTDTIFNESWVKERPLINGIYQKVGRQLLHHTNSIRCVNQKNFTQINEMFGQQPKPLMRIIPVPAQFYRPEYDELRAQSLRTKLLEGDEQGQLILFVGRLVPVKRVDVLLRIFARLRERYPQARLVIAGDGSEMAMLRNLSQQLGPERINFVGYVPETEVFAYYGACDFFVNPADVEPYGRVYIEAMSANKAVISTTDSGAVEDGLCVDQQSALLFAPGDEAALEQAITRLLDDKSLSARLGEEGNRLAREKFDYQLSLKRMGEFWHDTIYGS